MEGKQWNSNTERERRWKIYNKRLNDLVSEVVFFFFLIGSFYIWKNKKNVPEAFRGRGGLSYFYFPSQSWLRLC